MFISLACIGLSFLQQRGCSQLCDFSCVQLPGLRETWKISILITSLQAKLQKAGKPKVHQWLSV